MKNSKEKVLKLALENDVRYVRLQFTDLLGTLKNVEIPVRELEKAIDGEIMFDGSSIEGFVRIKEADMFLRPDLDTWLILQWEQLPQGGKVARLICDVYNTNNEPFTGDPRSNLKRVIKTINEEGFLDLNIGVEPEFFLFKLNEKGEPILTPNDNGGYFDQSPIDGAEDCRRDIVLELEKLGFYMEASHHEVAPGQHEINFRFSSLLEACDNLQTFKLVVKNVAKRHGLHASFMPKPIANINGNGMHTNCSLVDLEGKNAFYDKEADMQLSKTAKNWIAGILRHARGFAAITNPTVNSYKRLIPGYEAPCYISWSDHNRSTLIRIPASRGAATRTEIRNVDPTANPYLAMAVILMAGLDGIKNEWYIEPVYKDLFSMSREERESIGILNLPENLKDAVKELKKDEVIKAALGEHIFAKYVEAKNQEWDAYRKTVHEWEIKKYLLS